VPTAVEGIGQQPLVGVLASAEDRVEVDSELYCLADYLRPWGLDLQCETDAVVTSKP
jgi:hypothetical protein